MTSTADRILTLIDDGLQSSSEHGHGHDVRGLCVRCQCEEPAEGEFCSGCRSFLLGDSSVDPAVTNDDLELVNAYGEVIGTFTAADPTSVTRWQAEARRHLGDCFDELASLTVPVRQGEPIIVVADDIGEVTRLLSGNPTDRGHIPGLPMRMRNGLLVTSPNTALARYSERGAVAPAAWFLADGQVRVAECWMCGCPVSWIETDEDSIDSWERPPGGMQLIPRPARRTLAPCGHSTSHVAHSGDPAACLYQITIYDSTHLAKVASWLAAWPYWIAGEVPEPGPRLATAETIISTL